MSIDAWNDEIAHNRRDYEGQKLSPDVALDDPFEQLSLWLKDAKPLVLEPTAFTLSTANAAGAPNARVVLMRGLDHGLLFYTNYLSQKGQELATQQLACATFFWPELSRQIRISGEVTKTDRTMSETYFDSRPQDSRKNAIASPQSQVIEENTLRQRLDQLEEDLKTQPQALKCPEHWGGYRLTPNTFEFWQGQPNRLHDRVRYVHASPITSAWEKVRIAP